MIMNVIGTWRLIEAVAHDDQGQLLAPPYGPVPMGRIVFTESGRMMAVVCDGRTSLPPGVERAYASYCGNYRIDGQTLTTEVDAAAIRERVGGLEIRQIRGDGDRLVLISPRRPNGEQRQLFWHYDGVA